MPPLLEDLNLPLLFPPRFPFLSALRFPPSRPTPRLKREFFSRVLTITLPTLPQRKSTFSRGFWSSLGPRPRDQETTSSGDENSSEAVRSSCSNQFLSLSFSVLSWHVFRFPCYKRVCEVAWVQIKSASWIPWEVSDKVHLKRFFCFGKFEIALPWMRERS